MVDGFGSVNAFVLQGRSAQLSRAVRATIRRMKNRFGQLPPALDTRGETMHSLSFITRSIALFLFTAFATAAFAADAGTVEKVTGKVTITGADNVVRAAGPRERIMSGETIATDAKSETMVKMADESTILLRPNTRFQLTEYKYDKAATDSSVMTLLRGTMRMVTGIIGKRRPTNVRVNTLTATIGIRGTDFEVAVIPEDTPEARAGVYDFVHDGVTNIRLTQLDRTLDVKKNQTAFAPDKPKPGEDPLQLLSETPLFLQSGGGLDALIESLTIQIPMFR
jgi:hypothetical protein